MRSSSAIPFNPCTKFRYKYSNAKLCRNIHATAMENGHHVLSCIPLYLLTPLQPPFIGVPNQINVPRASLLTSVDWSQHGQSVIDRLQKMIRRYPPARQPPVSMVDDGWYGNEQV